MFDENINNINSHETENILKKYCPQVARISSKFIFGASSAVCSVFLMIEPCKTYTKTSDLGKTLIQYFGEKEAWKIPFASSALDFMGLNFFFAPAAIQRFIEYISSLEGVRVKVVKGTGILILAGVANIQPIAVALSTGSNFTQTMLSAIGLMPASLLSTLNLLTLELPALLRKLDGSDKEHKRFNQDLRDAWIYQLKHRNRTVNQAQSLGERWAILLQDLDQAKIDECLGSRVSREIIRGIGLLATGPLSWANFWNLQEVMVAALPWGFGVPGRILGGIVSIGFTYIFGKLVSNLFVGIYDAARNLVLGRAVDSLPLQLINRLVITTVAVGLCAVGTSLSFPTALALFMHAYHLIFKEQLSYEVMAAIDIYHLVGLIECISLVLKAFYAKCGSTQEKSLLRFHEAVEVAEKLNPKEIVAQLKKTGNDDLYNKYFKEVIQTTPNRQTHSKSGLLSWCCHFGLSDRNSQEETESLLGNEEKSSSGFFNWKWCS